MRFLILNVLKTLAKERAGKRGSGDWPQKALYQLGLKN
jgi:hypothetical protein